MDLLAGVRPTIYAALEDVKDTFLQVSVVIHSPNIGGVNRFMEDMDTVEGKKYTDITLEKCMLEFGSNEKQTDTTAGTLDETQVKVTVFVNDLQAASLWDNTNNTPAIRTEEAYFTTQGQRYRVRNVVTDAYFETLPTLVYIVGEKTPKIM